MGEWLQDKCLVSVFQLGQRKAHGDFFVSQGILRKRVLKVRKKRTLKKDSLCHQASGVRNRVGETLAQFRASFFTGRPKTQGQTHSLTFDPMVHVFP